MIFKKIKYIIYFISEGGDVNDAIDIIMRNLSESNKLWIRLS